MKTYIKQTVNTESNTKINVQRMYNYVLYNLHKHVTNMQQICNRYATDMQ